jgi:hypothetical protein
MNPTRHSTQLILSSTDNRATATLSTPGLGTSATVSRSGPDEESALSATLRAMADLLDAHRRATRRSAGESVWVRMDLVVDVRVPFHEARLAEEMEDRARAGDGKAADKVLSLTTGWLAAALHDSEARNWQAFDWSEAEDPGYDVD